MGTASDPVTLLGVRLVGVTPENGRKLILTVAALAIVWGISKALRWIARRAIRDREDLRLRFWSNQGIHLITTGLFLLFFVSLWFDDPARLSTAAALVTAGLAFALQKVVTAVAAYFVILRSHVFNLGDRIKMGGVRGEVIALGYVRTTVMEMGQSPAEQDEDPGMWVEGRQYTGRVVTITNDKIFEEPIYNYTRAFPFLWEEIKLPVHFRADRDRAEQILLEAARRHTMQISEVGESALEEMRRKYYLSETDLQPCVYYRVTDNWLEMSLRFIARTRGVRELKDAMWRDILRELDAAGIGVASATFEIVGAPPLRIEESAPRPAAP